MCEEITDSSIGYFLTPNSWWWESIGLGVSARVPLSSADKSLLFAIPFHPGVCC